MFSGLTVLFHNDFFIKIKLSIIDGILALALFIGLAMGKQPLKALLGEALKLSDETWRKLTFRYALFFAALALHARMPATQLVKAVPSLLSWGAAFSGKGTMR